jgi:hypothetical protein
MKILTKFLVIALSVSVIFACSKQEENSVYQVSNSEFFTKADISNVKAWMKEQAKQPTGREIEFPKLSLKLSQSSSDSALINFYQNGMMYINDDKINGKTNNYEVISKMIREDERLDDNAKIFLLSSIQLSNEVLTTQ